MASLQDQFLKAGLINQKKVNQAKQDQNKQKKEERRTGVKVVDDVRQAAAEAQRKQAERARELNAQRVAANREKEVAAQIAQMVQQSRQSKGNGDIAYNFTYENKVKRIYVSAPVQAHLTAGRLVIICQGEVVELVPKVVADKIAERNPAIVVRVSKSSAETLPAEDDPYADYKIPDDFTW